MKILCTSCYPKVESYVEVSSTEIEEADLELCYLCKDEVFGIDSIEVDDILVSDGLADDIRAMIVGCWNHGCARVWDGVDKEWGLVETNSTVEEAFVDAWHSLDDENYKKLLDDVDVTDLDMPDISCPNCSMELDNWYDEVKVKAFIRTLPYVPELPKELNELSVPHEYQKIEFFRPDCSKYLVHLTKSNILVEGYGNDDYESTSGSYNAPQTLFIILKTQMLKPNKGIGMHDPAVCFTEKSLTALKETLFGSESNLRKGRKGIQWKPYGLMFEKKYLQEKFNSQPVLNFTNEEIQKLKEDKSPFLFRIVKNDGSISWLHEREWRVERTMHFDSSQAIVIVPTFEQAMEYSRILDEAGIKVKGFLPILDVSAAI